MAKVKVFIEETLCKEIEFHFPDNFTVEKRMELAEQIARESYKNNQIVLSADDFNGQTQIMLQDVETGSETDWNDL